MKKLRDILLKFYENDPGKVDSILFASDEYILRGILQEMTLELIETLRSLLAQMIDEDEEFDPALKLLAEPVKRKLNKRDYGRLANARSRLRKLKYTVPKDTSEKKIYYTIRTERRPLLEKRYAETYGFHFEFR